MAKWFYYKENNEKIEITGSQLKGLAKAGVITPDTMVETEGKTAPARKVTGLTFATATQSESQPVPMGRFCTSCGNPVTPNIKFCPNCGSPMSATPVQSQASPMQPVISPQSGEHPFGKVLASSNGKESPNVSGTWLAGIVFAIVLPVSFMFLSYSVYRYASDCARIVDNDIKRGNYDSVKVDKDAAAADRGFWYSKVIFVVGLITPVIAIFLAALISRIIAGSVITVYENGVTGITGIDLRPQNFQYKPSVFQFTYDQITSVNVLKDAVIIQVSGVSYSCYTKNELVADEICRVILTQQDKHKTRSLT